MSAERQGFCPCRFPRTPIVAGRHVRQFSAEWYAMHRDHHLAVFPDVDQVTRDNLRASIERAKNRD